MSDTRSASRTTQAITGACQWEHVNAGSLQRIADACEKMAASYDNMRTDRDYYKGWLESEKRTSEKLRRRVAALQGAITKLKKRTASEGTR